MSSMTMRVQKLELKNFRGIRSLALDFSGNTTVLVGVNGAGKTSILEALRILLAQFIYRLQDSISGDLSSSDLPVIKHRLFLHSSDMQVGTNEYHIDMRATVGDRNLSWSIHAQSSVPGEYWYREAEVELRSFASDIGVQALTKPLLHLPLAIYYSIGNSVKADDSTKELKPQNQLAAYEEALTGAKPSANAFASWFRQREDYENERRIEDSSFRDAQLQALRLCIENLLPGFDGLRIRRQPMRMVIRKGSTELDFQHLSEGERYLLTLGADIVRRLSLANPQAENPRLCSAVILIDEIDTHLHPSWQRRIIPALNQTFPDCQFIVATHSPQVLSNVPPESIYILSQEDGEFRAVHPEASFGRDSNRILEDLMGVDERPSEIKQKLGDYFHLLDEGRMEEAQLLRKELEFSIGSSDPEFTRADVLVHTRELLSR